MGETPKVLRLLLADDHAVVLMGLEALLSLDPGIEVVATADDGRTAVEAYRTHRPDVAVLDLRMPGIGGVEAAREILDEFPEATVLFLTSYETPDEIQRALNLGVAGYVLKRSTGGELVEAIKALATGAKWVPDRLLLRAMEVTQSSGLSERQKEVLSLVSKGMSNKEIAELLGFTESGTKQHVRQIFSKLGVTSRAEAVTEAIQRGILQMD